MVRHPLLSSPEIYEVHSLAGTSASTWSVKGIRVNAPQALAPEVNAEASTNNLFNAFVHERASDSVTPSVAPTTRARPQDRTEGTLVDWMSKQSTSKQERA